jgi:SbsC C-terminal domain/Transglycosylase SLT domain/Bacterial SH3 domain
MKRGLRMKNVLRTALLATVFSAVLLGGQSAEAATYSEAERLVKQAEGYAGTVKWDISYENTKSVDYPNMKAFNAAKTYKSKAETAISTLSSASQRTALNKRLDDNVVLHMKRATAYIDSITAGKKIVNQQNMLNASISSGNLDQVEENYHNLSFEIRKQAKLLYPVYGKSTREAILAKYKAPAESLRNGIMHEVTASMILDYIQALKLPEGVSSPDVPVKVNEYQSYEAYFNYPTLKTALNNKYSQTMNKIVLPQNRMKDLITEVAIDKEIPPEILKAIAYQEAGNKLRFNHFELNGEPMVSSDNGIGIMQITNHPTANVEDLKYNTRYNIEVGADLLKEKWSWTGNELPKVNTGDTNVLEDWYFAILAYNGRSSINHPNNSGNYQAKIYDYIRTSSQVPKIFYFSNLTYDISITNGILDFRPKMQYFTDIQNITTQNYKPGETHDITIPTGTLRSQPVSTSASVGILPKGTAVQILSKGVSDSSGANHYIWYEVKVVSTGQKGFIFSGAFVK